MTDQPVNAPAARRRPGPPPCPDPARCAHLYHCPTCGAGSANPGDAAHDYCGACGFQTPPAPAAALTRKDRA